MPKYVFLFVCAILLFGLFANPHLIRDILAYFVAFIGVGIWVVLALGFSYMILTDYGNPKTYS